MLRSDTTYGMKIRLDLPYDDAVEKVTAALKKEGFGVLTEIDVKSTLKQKLDADFRDYVILGACNPTLAHRALTTELEVGLLLPCNVIVFDDGEGTVVSIADPRSLIEMTGNPALRDVAAEAHSRLRAVLEALGG